MKVICTRCGGTNIACEAIVNPNTGKIIDYLDESFMHANCGDCKEEVVYSGFGETEAESRAMLLFDLLEKKILTPDGLNLKEVDRRKEYENEFE